MKNNKLEFYKNLYNAIEKLEKLYKDYFSLDIIKADICRSKYVLSPSQQQKEYMELVTLESSILATMIALNKEKLEQANSNIAEKNLFKYKDYESSMKIICNDGSFKEGIESSKDLCKILDFNKDENGPFPYMLEILKDNNKQRPYDYISKIRNALLHAEYYLENNEILHIQNHDDFGNLTFDANLLMFSFAIFVKDFFGEQGVDSSFFFYEHLGYECIRNESELIEFLCNFNCYEVKFTKLPSTHTFNGRDALYHRLCSCFKLDSSEEKDIKEELEKLKLEGFEFSIQQQKLSKEQIVNITTFVNKRYKCLFNNKDVLKHISSLVKLQFNPIAEITNCLDNILSYILHKKSFLISGDFTDKDLLEELKYDEYCDVAFLYTLTILKSHIINYVIECNEFENISLDFDISNITISVQKEFDRRKNSLMLEGLSSKQANNKIILEIIRNALAHGADRFKLSVDIPLKINLIDIYPNIPNLGIETNLNTLNNLFSIEEFRPENIKLKDNKVLSKNK